MENGATISRCVAFGDTHLAMQTESICGGEIHLHREAIVEARTRHRSITLEQYRWLMTGYFDTK